MKNIVSPANVNIFPGTISRITTPASEAAKIAREKASDRKLFAQILGVSKYPTQQTIFPGTIHSAFAPVTGKVSVTEQEVQETYALAQKAIAEGRIPPKSGQGRNLDVMI